MTPEQKAEIRARADASTPGPWHWNLPGQCCSGGYCCDDAGLHEVDYFYRVEMAFIAAARTDIPDLLDDIERLEAEVERLRAKVERVDALVETWLNRNISWRSSAEYVQAALDGEG